MKLKYILVAGAMALLSSCDESRFLILNLRGHLMTICCRQPMVWSFWLRRLMLD